MSDARLSIRLFSALAVCMLAGCGGFADGAPDELTMDRRDPAVGAALALPLMSDPMLVSSANANAVRPPPYPYGAPIPLSDVAAQGSTADLLAGERLSSAPEPRTKECPSCDVARTAPTLVVLAQPLLGACAGTLGYSSGWATRLPEDLPLIPGARLIEAAGTDAADCHARVLRFWTDLSIDTVMDWYFTQAGTAGYASDTGAGAGLRRLSGTSNNGSRFTLFAAERDEGGTRIDLIVAPRG